ncbi:RNase A-like domain-containing protein, partial [Luteimicrobium subarcticum]
INGQRVTTTDEHPFMVAGLGWIAARDLRAGDPLVTAGDLPVTAGDAQAGTVRLDAIDIERADEGAPDGGTAVYNIHVRTHHTYYVLAGGTPVLVHNANRHALDLAEHETAGGHVIERHVGKTDAYLRSRGIKFASTFPDVKTAVRVTTRNIRSNTNRIANWLAGEEYSLMIKSTMSPLDGRVYVAAADRFVDPLSVETFLYRDDSMAQGFRVHTSYPSPKEY